MNLNEIFPVRPAKVEALKERILRLAIDVAQIQESFVRGSGAGGQKINKTSNCVVLKYPALHLEVRCQESRQRALNRFLALRRLVDEIEFRIAPESSAKLKELSRIQKQKDRARRRSRSAS